MKKNWHKQIAVSASCETMPHSKWTEEKWKAFCTELLTYTCLAIEDRPNGVSHVLKLYELCTDLLFIGVTDLPENTETLRKILKDVCPITKENQIGLILNKLKNALLIPLLTPDSQTPLHIFDQVLKEVPNNALRFSGVFSSAVEGYLPSYIIDIQKNGAPSLGYNSQIAQTILSLRLVGLFQKISTDYVINKVTFEGYKSSIADLTVLSYPKLVLQNVVSFLRSGIEFNDALKRTLDCMFGPDTKSEIRGYALGFLNNTTIEEETTFSAQVLDFSDKVFNLDPLTRKAFSKSEKFKDNIDFRAQCYDPISSCKRLLVIEELVRELQSITTTHSTANNLGDNDLKYMRYLREFLTIQTDYIQEGERSWKRLENNRSNLENTFNISEDSHLTTMYERSEQALEMSKLAKAENRIKKAEGYQNIRRNLVEKVSELELSINNIATSLRAGPDSFSDVLLDIESVEIELNQVSKQKKGKSSDVSSRIQSLSEQYTQIKANEALTFYCTMTSVPLSRRPPARADFLSRVSNPVVIGPIQELYREHATLGDGGTAAILLEEIKSGKAIKCEKTHYYKAKFFSLSLARILENEPLTPMEKAVTSVVLYDLKKAIKTADKSKSFQTLLGSL